VTLAILNGHVVERPVRELTDTDAHLVTATLAAQGIHIEPVVDVWHVVHLWATRPVTTEQEVRAIRAFRDVTDCRLAWHGAVPSA
jgi:hypothetical protein